MISANISWPIDVYKHRILHHNKMKKIKANLKHMHTWNQEKKVFFNQKVYLHSLTLNYDIFFLVAFSPSENIKKRTKLCVKFT